MIKQFEEKFGRYSESYLIADRLIDVRNKERNLVQIVTFSGFDGEKVDALNTYVKAHKYLIDTIISIYSLQRGSDDFNWVFEKDYAFKLMGQLGTGYFFFYSSFENNKEWAFLDDRKDVGRPPILLEMIPEIEMSPVVNMYQAAIKQGIIVPEFKVEFDTEKRSHYSENPINALFLIN